MIHTEMSTTITQSNQEFLKLPIVSSIFHFYVEGVAYVRI